MHRHFENWNDMKHEARKFWSAETISCLIYAKLFPCTISDGESQTPLHIFLLGGGGVCTQAYKTSMVRRIISIDRRPKKPYAHHKSHLHTMKVYSTRPVSLTIKVFLIKILLFFDHWSNHLSQSNYKRSEAIEIVN